MLVLVLVGTRPVPLRRPGDEQGLRPGGARVYAACVGECRARSAKFWMSANTRTLATFWW